VNHARRDLCGGHPAMDVPTAIGIQFSSRTGVQSLAIKDSETSARSGGIRLRDTVGRVSELHVVRADCGNSRLRVLTVARWAHPDYPDQETLENASSPL
jgi:hypothetical protein